MPDFAKIIDKLNPKPEKTGLILVALNVTSMVLSAASNTFATMVDKNTSKEDKKFLVPAGAATGVANIGVYYLLTKKIIDGLENAASKAVAKLEKNGQIETEALEFAKKAINKAQKGVFNTGLFKKSDEYIASMKDTLLKDGSPTAAAVKEFKESVKGGAGVLGAFAGAVVGCSILTPIIRDVSAYCVQKKREKKNPELSNKAYMPYFDPSHIKTKNYKMDKRPMSLKNYMAFTNGNLKV